MPDLPEPSANANRPRRRLQRARRIVAGSIALVLVCVLIGIAWRSHRQAAAIRDIEKLGATVLNDEFGPGWLQSLLFKARLGSPGRPVCVRWYTATDAGAGRLEDLNGLKFLELESRDVTDEGVKNLSG